MIHFQPFAPDAYLIQKFLSVLHPFFGSEISFQEMAGTNLSSTYQDSVRPSLECFQNMNSINLACTGQFYNSHGRGILQAHGTGHIGGGVGTVSAQHSYYLGIKMFHGLSFLLRSIFNQRPLTKNSFLEIKVYQAHSCCKASISPSREFMATPLAIICSSRIC